jgi:hypothetical protein
MVGSHKFTANANIRNYIQETLKDLLGLSSRRRKKPAMSGADMEDFLHFIWVDDRSCFKHERFRIQLALFIQILGHTASRPGSVIVSDSYHKSNEVLTYKVRSRALSKGVMFLTTNRMWMC